MSLSKVIKPIHLVTSDEVVQIPDAPLLLENQEEEEISESNEKQLVTEEQIRHTIEKNALEKANEMSHKILQSARLERETLIAQAQEDAKRIRVEAQQSAYQKVLEDKHQQIDECISRVDFLLEDLQKQQQNFLQQYEDGLFSLALEIAEKVVRTSIPQHEELMIPLVREAVSAVKNADWIGVEVSDQLPKLVEALQKEFAAWKSIQISAAELPVDGCLVNTPNGVVDASASVQLENLKVLFEKSMG